MNPLTEFVKTILRSTPLLCLLAALTVSAQSGKNIKGSPAVRTPASVRIDVVESSEALHESLREKPALQFSFFQPTNITVRVDESRTYQQIDGFGAALTDSSAWLLSQKLTPAQRTTLFKQLFDTKQGIGLAILRQPMGSSDFSIADYSYDDVPLGESDPQLKRFTIDRDRQYILPVLREALAVNPKLKIIASPWSPPAWMKTSGSMIGGTLLPSSFIDHSKSPATVTPTVDFSALAHASNFVAPGALRIDSISSEETPLKHVAFRNSDGSIVLLALNPSESAITFSITWQSQYATYTLQPGAVVTFHWPPKSRTRH